MHIKILIEVISKVHIKTRGQIKKKKVVLLSSQPQFADFSVPARKTCTSPHCTRTDGGLLSK